MPESRASLSLIGYCSFQLMEYGRCVDVYSQLLDLCPNEQLYRLEYSRSLLKNGNHDAALRALEFVDEPGLRDEMLALKVSILFEMDELESCEHIINNSPTNGQWISIKASVLARQGQFVQAIDLYHQAQKELGYRAEIVYGLALSMYNLDKLQEALEKVEEILEYCRKHFPSLFPNPFEVVQKSVGNSRLLEHSYLVEATNLKALIQHSLRDREGAKKTMMQLPPRFENELDQISLHNLAVIGAECGEDMEAIIIKLEQILGTGKSPDGTVMNLAILYCKSGKYQKAKELISLYEQTLQETTNTVPLVY